MRSWIQKHSILLSFLLVLAVMVMIYCFSAQTGEESGAMSGEITRWLLSIFVPDFDAWASQEQESLLYAVGLIIRKLAHFSEYALLGFALLLHISQVQKKISVRLPALWAWGIGTLYAASDEFHQSFVGGRGPAVTDVMIDSAGVIAGVLIMAWLLHRKNRNRQFLKG